MKWLKRMLIALAVLLVTAVALPFFVSIDDYIPWIEKEVLALPLPHVTVEGITVGTTDDIRIGKALVPLALFSLLQPTRVIRSIEIDSLGVRAMREAAGLRLNSVYLRFHAGFLQI
jgi:hypothetical protein